MALGKHGLQPLACLTPVGVHVPKPPQGCREPQSSLGILLLCGSPSQRGSQVVMLHLQPAEPHRLLRPVYPCLRSLRQVQIPGAMPRPDRGGFSRRYEPVLSVLPDGLGHPVPHLPTQRLGVHQGLVHQLREKVQNIALLDALPSTDRFGGLQGAPPGKDGEPAQAALLESYVEELQILAPPSSSTAPDAYRFHSEIERASGDAYRKGLYREAALNAYIRVISAVKEKSGITDLDGDPLMNRVFPFERQTPVIQFNSLQTQEEKDEQVGFFYLFKGLVGLRNSKAHGLRIINDPNRAHEYLAFASLLMRVLEIATVNAP